MINLLATCYCISGSLTGHKLSGIKMRLLDGASHIVDSSEYAFSLAAIGAVQDGMYLLMTFFHSVAVLAKGRTVCVLLAAELNVCFSSSAFEMGSWMLLEPIMSVEISVPVEFQGAVMGIVSRRSGIVAGSEGKEGWVTINAEVSKILYPEFLTFSFSTHCYTH